MGIFILFLLSMIFIPKGINPSLARPSRRKMNNLLDFSYFGFSAPALAMPEIQKASGTVDPGQANYLRRVLQTEIDKGLVALDTTDDGGVTLSIGNESLFGSGAAILREDVRPLMNKIARALESTTGAIMVVGHTDSQPIATSRYPSNWHLSLARATSVSDELAGSAALKGRLWPEGRGDTEPRFDNSSAENRARNRRVEISLIP